MFNKLEIFPEEIIDINDGWKRSCTLVLTGEQIKKQETLWWEYPKEVLKGESSDCDSYLLSTFLLAMKHRADLYVHGTISHELLSNITELQKVWSKWLPEVYNEINIHVSKVTESTVYSNNAIVAFSGGADAQFTTYRHSKGLAGYRTKNISAGVLVHGFDIPLNDNDGFNGAAKKAKLALDDLGISLICVRTNVTEVLSLNWEHYCGSALSSVLHAFKYIAGYGLIASGESYDNLVIPWGSHPMTNPLLSSSNFFIVHDGAGFSRSEKIKTLVNWNEGVKQLRVCWSGGVHDRNCGKCEKCVRTRLNFLLAGVEQPDCFDTPFEIQMLSQIALASDAARAEWLMIKDEMINLGINQSLIKEVDKVIKRPAVKFSKILPVGSIRREWVKNFLGKNK